jgi:hypothetical protein
VTDVGGQSQHRLVDVHPLGMPAHQATDNK